MDRYKHSIYSHLSDYSYPPLSSIITRDHTATRFHACERFDRCDSVAIPNEVPWKERVGMERKADINKDGREVVYVNPVSMDLRKWGEYVRDVKGKLARGEAVSQLVRVSLYLPYAA